MTFNEIFTVVKEGLSGVDSSKIDPNFAVQVNLTGEGEGSFYIANKDGQFQVEPYTYSDRNGAITLAGDLLMKIINGDAKAELELAKGKIKIEGNPIALLKVFKEAKAAIK